MFLKIWSTHFSKGASKHLNIIVNCDALLSCWTNKMFMTGRSNSNCKSKFLHYNIFFFARLILSYGNFILAYFWVRKKFSRSNLKVNFSIWGVCIVLNHVFVLITKTHWKHFSLDFVCKNCFLHVHFKKPFPNEFPLFLLTFSNEIFLTNISKAKILSIESEVIFSNEKVDLQSHDGNKSETRSN